MLPSAVIAPPKKDNRVQFPNVLNQLDESACGGFMGTALFLAELIRRKSMNPFQPAPQFTYRAARRRMGKAYLNVDSGVDNRSLARSMKSVGVVSEALWPYSKPLTEEPPKEVYTEALRHQLEEYQWIRPNVAYMRQCLAQGYCFGGGIPIFESFEYDSCLMTGDVPIPGRNEELLGYHDIPFHSYDDTRRNGDFVFRNSWGADVGDRGDFYLPYDYIENVVERALMNFVRFRMVEDAPPLNHSLKPGLTVGMAAPYPEDVPNHIPPSGGYR
jgi:hypothetical protein